MARFSGLLRNVVYRRDGLTLHLYVLTFGAGGKVCDNFGMWRAPSSSSSLRETPGASPKFSFLHLIDTQSLTGY